MKTRAHVAHAVIVGAEWLLTLIHGDETKVYAVVSDSGLRRDFDRCITELMESSFQ